MNCTLGDMLQSEAQYIYSITTLKKTKAMSCIARLCACFRVFTPASKSRQCQRTLGAAGQHAVSWRPVSPQHVRVIGMSDAPTSRCSRVNHYCLYCEICSAVKGGTLPVRWPPRWSFKVAVGAEPARETVETCSCEKRRSTSAPTRAHHVL